MKQKIILIFVFLTSSAQQPTPWTNPYFYYHYNAPLALPGQTVSANEMLSDQKQFSSYDDQSVQNTLGSHVVLLTTCLRELKTTNANLVQSYTEVENVKKELKELKAQLLAHVVATVEFMKNEMSNMVTKTNLAQTTQRLDETHTSRVETFKNKLTNVMNVVENIKKETNATKADLVQSRTEVENVRNELKEFKENTQVYSTLSAQHLANVVATVENVKNVVTGMVTKTDLVQTTQRLDEIHTTRVESFKKDLTNVMTTVENLKKATNALSVAPSSIGRMPKSCADLQQIGHRKSGLFSVMGSKTVDNVYCDFTKPTTDADFQKMIGYVDVKTSPVYFHAQRSSNFVKLNATIPFDSLRLNVGNAMSTSGIFVAPKPGKYSFSCSGISLRNVLVRVELQVKTARTNWARIGQAFGSANLQTFSLQSTLQLAGGDQIRLLLAEGAIFDDLKHHTNFVGQLLEEEMIH